jgi:hypothetical protein
MITGESPAVNQARNASAGAPEQIEGLTLNVDELWRKGLNFLGLVWERMAFARLMSTSVFSVV